MTPIGVWGVMVLSTLSRIHDASWCLGRDSVLAPLVVSVTPVGVWGAIILSTLSRIHDTNWCLGRDSA